MAELTLTELRKDLFRVADRVLETGEPVVVVRKGRRLVLQPERPEITPEARWARYLARIEERKAAGNEPRFDFGDFEAAREQLRAELAAAREAKWDELYGPEKPHR
jgi:antitoxin (DNA-binding transcriptional repressor) of toxin-antitoxin stability system